MTDDDLLAGIPDFLSFNTLMKARAQTEDGERVVYFEAANESRDQQGEVVLRKALEDSVDYFLKFGVVDIDHKSMPSVAAKFGIEKPEEWAIGRPVAVKFKGGTTFVKAVLHKGNTALAERANTVWEGLTKLVPPMRYYASVGGAVQAREIRIDPKTGDRTPVVTKVRWNNLAATLSPVNPDLDVASAAPLGVFAKSMGGWVMTKTLTAGYGTDAATMTGGRALSCQSLAGIPMTPYQEFRNGMAKHLRAGAVGRNPSVPDMVFYAKGAFGLDLHGASEWVDRFLRDTNKELSQRRSK